MKKIQKISIIGAGAIGTQTALYLQQESMYLQKNSIREIVLYNHNYDLAYGEASDIVDSMSFYEQFSEIDKLQCKLTPTYKLKDIQASDIVIITAGASKIALKTKDRLAELPITYEIAKRTSLAIRKYAKDALVIVISNPVDIVTWFVQEISQLPTHKVIGVGVASDSARYAYNLKEEFKKYNVQVDSVNSLVIGAHRGSDMVMIESTVKVNDQSIYELEKYILNDEQIKNILDNAKEQTYVRAFHIATHKRQRGVSINPATIAATIASVYLRKKTIKLPMALVVGKEDLKKYNINVEEGYKTCTGLMTSIGPNGAEIESLELSQSERDKLINVMNETRKIKENFELEMSINKYEAELDKGNPKKYILSEDPEDKNLEINSKLNLYANNDNLTS